MQPSKNRTLVRTSEEVDEDLQKLENLDSILEELVIKINKIHSEKITREHVFLALYLELQNKYYLEHPLDFWSLDLSFEEAYSVLKRFDFKTVLFPVETSLDSVPKDFVMGYKVRIKNKGLIWLIHKYDRDPFPSDPHAHLIDSGLKMDLSNGRCYRKKEFVHKIKRKDLLELRKKAQAHFELPDLKI